MIVLALPLCRRPSIFTYKAFDLAVRYRNPVMVLMDG